MMDISIFLDPIVQLFKQWRLELRENKAEGKAEMERALEALSKALLQTGAYLRSREESGPNRTREVELADYWRQASIALRIVNSQLARNCADKVNYWLHPERWTDEQVARHGIDIERIREKYSDLLAPPERPGPA